MRPQEHGRRAGAARCGGARRMRASLRLTECCRADCAGRRGGLRRVRLRGPSRSRPAGAAAPLAPSPARPAAAGLLGLKMAQLLRFGLKMAQLLRFEMEQLRYITLHYITLHYITLYFGFVSSESFAGGRPGPASSETAHGGPRTPPRPRPGSRTFRPAPAARSPRQSLPIDSLRRRRRTTSDHIRVAPAL